jgi:Icc-related predicted phosphoesterase
MKRLFSSRNSTAFSLVLYYASDVHGSERCWRKFLGAPRFYGASKLVMGGDLTGKAIVPIVLSSNGAFTCSFLGEDRSGSGDEARAELEAAIRFNGMYPWPATADEIAAVADSEAAQAELFNRLLRDEAQRWVELADERLREQDVEGFVIAGNDDPWFIDDVLATGTSLHFCDDQVVRVADHEMLSLSYANRTPWDSPRELDEDALYERIDRLAQQLEEPETAIFNLHVPPFDSGLDRVVELDDQLQPVFRSGTPVQVPAGSTAVREIIEEYQPAVSLHGHIHESKGEAQLGRTLSLNSGSEYNSGRIHGVLVRFVERRAHSHQFVVG